MGMERRFFLKEMGLLAAGIFLEPKELFASSGLEQRAEQGIEQRIIINLPAYELKLMNLADGEVTETHTFHVSIGRGAEGRAPTPISEGAVYDKRKRILFRYGEDFPQYNKKKGDVIYWNNTFDEEGKPKSGWVPYREFRGLGMKLKPINMNYYDFGKVIHSSLDDFTIGLPTSHGCVGMTKKDMLSLYGLVAPHVDNGELKSPINIKTIYEILELKQGQFVIHANVYQRPKEYMDELNASLIREGRYDITLDDERVKKEFADAGKDFVEAQKQIIAKLLKGWPNNYIAPELKKRLHRTYNLNDFKKAEV